MNKSKIKYYTVFIISFIMMFLIMLPNIIKNHGFFTFVGDYAFQQIPFFYHAANTVQHMRIGWDWYTGLGTDFIGSYTYYFIGSIFFWAISWLPGRMIIYAMPVMLAAKTGLASLTSYIYIKRYTEKDEAAFIGAVLYAFSGFQMYNLIYNSFHDVTALFPLLILSFDKLVMENKKCFFAVMTGVMALTNYFFFYGQVVFIIIYYILRCVKGDFKFKVGNFINIFFESVVGVMISAVIILPTVNIVLSGDRVSSILLGTDLVSYSDNVIIPKIFQGMFLIPDPLGNAQLFWSEQNEINWASISVYLPLFTVTCMIVYIKNNKKNWISFLLLICLFMACIPVLNSAFSMFNSSYYARWFYMPILFICIATSVCIDKKYDIIYGIKIQGIALAVLCIIFMFPKEVLSVEGKMANVLNNKNLSKHIEFFSMSDIPIVFWQSVGFGIVSLLVLYLYNVSRDKDERILKKITAVLLVFTVIVFSSYIQNSVDCIDFEDYNETMLDFCPELDDDEIFYRVSSLNESVFNGNMIWNCHSAEVFHSIVPHSAEKFYSEVQGKARMMMEDYKENDYTVHGLLSTKYIFNRSTGDDLNVELKRVSINGFKLYDKQGYYYIYENENFVPIGNIYRYCISDNDINEYLSSLGLEGEKKYKYKKIIMMRALILDEEDIEKYSSYIEKIPENMLDSLDDETYFSDCREKADNSCSSFKYDSKGFEAYITAEHDGIVYFSVPFYGDWYASVNGKNTDIIKVHYGMMAVPVNCGENNIVFSYETPGLKMGFRITILGIIILLIYFLVNIFVSRYHSKETQ